MTQRLISSGTVLPSNFFEEVDKEYISFDCQTRFSRKV